MTPEEAAAYYDDPANARSMCDLLMRTHPGWQVWRVERTYCTEPFWCARRDSWAGNRKPLDSENAGLLNLFMFMTDAGAVVS